MRGISDTARRSPATAVAGSALGVAAVAAVGALLLAGCTDIDTPSSSAAATQPVMTYERADAIVRSFHGSVCPANFVTTFACFDAGIDVAAGRLVFVGKNGDRSHAVPLAGLRAETGSRGLGTSIVRVDGSWELLIIGEGHETAARLLADALTQLPVRAQQIWASQALFPIIARAYRSLPVKPVPGEDVRRLVVQAEDAVKQEQFTDAARLYGQIVAIAPWWPAGHYNCASILAEGGDFHDAVIEMQHYLALAPDALNARQMQDKIYVWQRQDKTVAAEPDPASFFPPPEPGKPRLGAIPANVPPIAAAARHLPNSDGALILYVARGGAADAAGLAPEDIIAAYDGQPVKTAADLAAAVRRAPPGAEVPVEIIRGDRRQRVTVRF